MERYLALLKDFGYDFQGNVLIEKGIRGFTSSRVIGRFPNAMAAAEYLCPIVKDDEFTRRLMAGTV